MEAERIARLEEGARAMKDLVRISDGEDPDRKPEPNRPVQDEEKQAQHVGAATTFEVLGTLANLTIDGMVLTIGILQV